MELQELKQDYEFFSSIPAERWITGDYCDDFGRCAIGHRFAIETFITGQLNQDIIRYENGISDIYENMWGARRTLPDINDGEDPRYPQSTPKERVLAFLLDAIKAKEAVEEVNNIIHTEIEEYETV